MRRILSWLRARPVVMDWVLVLVVLAPSVPLAFSPVARPTEIVTTLLLAAGLPVRRHYPLLALWGSLAVFGWQVLWGDERFILLPADLALLAQVYALIVYGHRRGLWPVVIVGEALIVTWAVRMTGWEQTAIFVAALPTALLVAVIAVADGVATRTQQLAEATDRARDLQEKREALARAAVAEERGRIAREMHDVVAHAVSTMVMQSEGARLLGQRDPAAVDQALRTISATGREAVGELRRVLGLLREAPAELTPQPGADALGALAETTRTAGIATRLDVRGTAEGVSPAAAMTAHRIVQEALTNVLKHAPAGARCTVTVDYGEPSSGPRVLALSVANDGGFGVERDRPVDGSGYGVLGMRERVALFDGELTAAPAPGGGFVVTARLPLSEPPEPK